MFAWLKLPHYLYRWWSSVKALLRLPTSTKGTDEATEPVRPAPPTLELGEDIMPVLLSLQRPQRICIRNHENMKDVGQQGVTIRSQLSGLGEIRNRRRGAAPRPASKTLNFERLRSDPQFTKLQWEK